MPRNVDREPDHAEEILRILHEREMRRARIIAEQRARAEQVPDFQYRPWRQVQDRFVPALRMTGQRRIVGRGNRNSNPNRKIMLEKSKKEKDV